MVPTLPPAFTWSRLTPGELFVNGEKSAVWEGGFVCANEDGTGFQLLELRDRVHGQFV